MTENESGTFSRPALIPVFGGFLMVGFRLFDINPDTPAVFVTIAQQMLCLGIILLCR